MFFGRHTCLPWIFENEGHKDVPILAEIGGAPPYVIVVGDRRRATRILTRLDKAIHLSSYCGEKLGELATGRVDLGIGLKGGVPIMVTESQMGGSATEIIMREVLDESFHPGGAKAVIRVGSCGTVGEEGSLAPLAIASFATGWSAAIEQWQRGVLSPPTEHEGDRPETPPIVPCTPAVVAALQEGAGRVAVGVKAAVGGIFSKDSLYSEQDDRFADILLSLDCIATEMELSTIGPIANWKKIAWGGIMAAAGRVPDGPWLEPQEIEINENRAIDATLEAIQILAAG